MLAAEPELALRELAGVTTREPIIAAANIADVATEPSARRYERMGPPSRVCLHYSLAR
jgi:hypothetical protein